MADGTAANRILQPSKKRVKLSQDDAASEHSTVSGSQRSQPRTPPGQTISPAAPNSSEPGFTIYSGPEVPDDDYEDPPPPTTHLSELFATPAPSTSNAAADPVFSDDQTNIRNTAFTFTFPDTGFQPITSTPIANFAIGPMPTSTSIPYPEPPTSPTPSPERGRRGSAFGSPLRSPARGRPGGGRLPSLPAAPAPVPVAASGSTTLQPPSINQPPQFISPAALLRTPPPPPVSEPSTRGSGGNNQASLGIGIGRPRSSGIGMGPVALPLPMPPDTPAPPMKRTMYGTELDSDSRFGDFGQDGVAMGFWTGVTPRF